MGDKGDSLAWINKAISDLKDAKQNIKKGEHVDAEDDAKEACKYIMKAFPDLKQKKKCHPTGCCSCYCRCKDLSHRQRITSRKFFAKVSGGTLAGQDLVIPISSFSDQDGGIATLFPFNYEFTTLYVNGMMQQNGIFAVTHSAIIIAGGANLDQDDPVAVEFIMQR
ncbi:hypothetical protein CIG75_13105 [Tumebacillus algifaecis]|uniref:DUF4183 domain-containing protein n=1 Tax=Tumebacillus algifaecis TaxID=1214604 RepID=A0A223D2J4_9BACL|nr:DUF4183 domain-containing protein [Tumebacillus algifaecis]ASS75832.1 hypothetical protein CIG75_13105 [Tumebacillus algifaecis]